jgi:hypothetical protein
MPERPTAREGWAGLGEVGRGEKFRAVTADPADTMIKGLSPPMVT